MNANEMENGEEGRGVRGLSLRLWQARVGSRVAGEELLIGLE